MRYNLFLSSIFFAVFLFCAGRVEVVFAKAMVITDESRSMDITVRFDPARHKIFGEAITRLKPLTEAVFRKKGFDLKEIKINGKVVTPKPESDSWFFKISAPQKGADVVIRFERNIQPDPTDRTDVTDVMKRSDFVALLDNWCPIFEGLAYYRLSATIPKGLVAVSEADDIEEKGTTDNRGDKKYVTYVFDFPHPRDDVSLVIGQYQISKLDCGSIGLYAYLFPEDSGLASTYLKKARDYIKFYEGLIGPYPFKRFAVVENMAPTGLGFATYTLLGQQVIRLPFIVDTSFGHEILHSWFGNSIYVDYGQGNWCEGLTTYLADYLYKERKGEGKAARHDMLINYQSYVHKDNTLPIHDFASQFDKAAKAVGYDKCAFVFHMLRHEIGNEAFYKAIKKLVSDYSFKVVSWNDLEHIFSQVSGKDLSYFFSEWLGRSDVPILSITMDPSATGIIIEQHTEIPYVLDVPMLVETASGAKTLWKKIDAKKNIINLGPLDQVLSVTLDPNYDIFRQLSSEEFPTVLSRLFGAEKRYFVMPQSEVERRLYAGFVRFLRHIGFSELEMGSTVSHDGLKDGSFIALGDQAAADCGVKPLQGDIKNGVSVDVRSNPFNSKEVAVVINASSEKELVAVQMKLLHCGRYSFLRFENGTVVDKGQKTTRDGIGLEVMPEVSGIASKDISSLDDILDKVASKRVIFFGERHDNFGHHLAELQVIKGLCRRGRKIAVGMEMFQHPFQVFIDRYLKGEIDERQFLTKTEYYKRWGYDYHLYRPIIEFCKAHSIPIVALNLRSEISRKVARDGLSSLTTDEKKEIPKDIDLSNAAYRNLLRNVFDNHPEGVAEDFERFFEAQVLWDEAMAKGIYEYLDNNPKRQMVVLAGAGHVAFGYGIPSRLFRRGDDSQAIIIAGGRENIERGMADYFLFPSDVPAPFSAKLGVLLDDKGGRLIIKEVMPGSVAQSSGLRAGDVILAFDGRPLKTVEDLKLDLLFKDEGSKASIRILRKGKTLKDEIIEVGPFESQNPAMQDIHRRISTGKDRRGAMGR
ncbi:MAG: ChaN family lipoprotein [Dissulfurimicrobium sp.]|uniref:ChaN family lipoprotein n=1 Tax=Dissulfurimicrobium sp. TaxID=2022436 RepID=UPI003D0A4AED